MVEEEEVCVSIFRRDFSGIARGGKINWESWGAGRQQTWNDRGRRVTLL